MPPLRLLAGLATATLAGLSTVAPVPTGGVAAVARAACDATSSGVTVVVDFRGLGGGITIACAPGDPGTGLAALTGAGFGVAGTNRWGLAFVCRINGLPTAATESCADTPPASAYWSYWHAPRGGGWSYSSLGAASFNPEPGSVEGWSFGSGAPPGTAPPPPPVQPPVQPPAEPPAPPPPSPPAISGGGGSDGAAGTSIPESTVDSSPSRSASPSPSPTSAGPVTSTSIVDPPVAANEPRGPGGATGTLVGVGLVAVIAAAAGVIGLRRRLRTHPSIDALPTDDHAD
jgi:hypothetical protein